VAGPSTKAAKASPRTSPPAELYLQSTERALDEANEFRIVGMDDGPVPKFRLRAADGKMLDSAELEGKPFVVVFFATWCQMCAMKLPLLRAALESVGPVATIGVSVDEPETWPQASAFLRENGLRFPLVRAAEFPRFSLAYNPFSLVPLVVVVGRNGGLVDYQMGYAPSDRERFIAAVKLARTIGPLAPSREQRQEHHQ
jgi:peroxiredoxin